MAEDQCHINGRRSVIIEVRSGGVWVRGGDLSCPY